MLPESKSYLKGEHWNDQEAGFLMMGCFIGGFIGIQAVSRLLHQYMPSHVVDCDHTHDEPPHGHSHHGHNHNHSQTRTHSASSQNGRISVPNHNHENDHTTPGESTPLLSADSADANRRATIAVLPTRGRQRSRIDPDAARRPSMLEVQKSVISFVKDTKRNCDVLGSCYGYSDPCGQECFKHISYRTAQRQPAILRTTTGTILPPTVPDEREYTGPETPVSSHFRTSRATSRDATIPIEEECESDDHGSCHSSHDEDLEAQHHHHVPTNAFLSIGLQTSIAIALHKFPEGFITYATNHVNPSLGFNVFMALFVHNITEGFAMALPLYMALGSRWRAMAWSALLGGLSQPFGALIAVLWFHLAKRTNIAPNGVAYACLFAVTAGIMVSVALQLFVESLSFNHNRNLCIFFAFLGMALLGLSNALFAAH